MKTLIITYLGILFFFGCSSTQQQTSKTVEMEESVYVFDDVTNVDTVLIVENSDTNTIAVELHNQIKSDEETDSVNTVSEENSVIKKYFVQLGAFSTLERANNFVNEIQTDFDFPLEIFFNDKVNLFTVRTVAYDNREDAEKLRDNLKKNKKFSDAFIVTE